MAYRFAVERENYSDLASGRVIRSIAGHPALPVRLADEVFRRCVARRKNAAQKVAITLYDPCCGAGYHLAALGFLHAAVLRRIVGSDILSSAVEVAQRNLSLLGVQGMSNRIREIERMETEYGKSSHREARESAMRLRDRLAQELEGRSLETRAFVCDALSPGAILRGLSGEKPEIVIADVPYGQRSEWLGETVPEPASCDRIEQLLDALRAGLEPGCIVAIVSDKGQKAGHSAYQQLERFQIGKRRATLLGFGG